MTHCFNARTKLFLLGLIIFSVAISSCKKDLDSLGSSLIGVRNGFQTDFDTTMDLVAYTVKMDTIKTNSLSTYALGILQDPHMGTTQADLIFQYGLPANSFTWEGATKLDSAVLQLRFKDLDALYGDPDAIHTLKVYQLDESLSTDSSYFSNRTFAKKSSEMGTWTGKFNLKDTLSLKLGSETFILPPHIRIKLNNTFETLLYGAETRGEFASTTAFKSAFKGFVIVDESNITSGNGGICYIRLSSDVTALTAYYKDTLAADFPVIPGNEVTANSFRNFNQPNNFLQQAFHGTHRDSLFVQPLGGTKVRIEIPEKYLKDNINKAINGAEIVFNVLEGTNDSKFTLPTKLQLVGSDSMGSNIFIKDLAFESSAYYGGTYNSSYKQYRFNIARHMQYLLNEYKANRNVNYGLYLLVPVDNPFTASRVVLDSRKNLGKIRLKLTTTSVK
jgi:hypothetical protein